MMFNFVKFRNKKNSYVVWGNIRGRIKEIKIIINKNYNQRYFEGRVVRVGWEVRVES